MFDAIAFGALIRRKRGEIGLTQAALAEKVFGNQDRKADISRFERAQKTPQEDTVQKLCEHLEISDAEMEPIRQARPMAAQLDQIPTLSLEELQNLAGRFGIEGAFDATDPQALRGQLTLKADEYRALQKQVEGIDPKMQRLSNLKAAAEDALERGDLDEVDEVLLSVQTIELEEAAKTAELRADTALLRGRVEEAYRILSVAADSFASVDPLEPARRRILSYFAKLRNHGLRYGGLGLPRSLDLLDPVLNDALQSEDARLWAAGMNWQAIAFSDIGERIEGKDGAAMLADAVAAYRAALEVFTRAEHSVDWAISQNNLGVALQDQGRRTEGPEGAALLAEAVAAYRTALEVRTRAEHSVDWAITQHNLGGALWARGIRTEGPEGAALLAEAVAVFRAALEVRTRADEPVRWAMTQNNLGNALSELGKRTEGPEGAALLAEAVVACRLSLELRTRADHPVDWAKTQENLAIAEDAWAEHDTTEDPKPHLEAALAHVDAALEIFDPEHMSYNHAKASKLREEILAKLAALD